MGAPRLLVFDWDGTLADSEAAIVRSVHYAIERLDLPARSHAQIREIIGLGLEQATQTLFPGHDSELAGAFAAVYRRHFTSALRGPIELFAGVQSALVELRERGYRLAVATGKGRAGLDRQLEETGLGPVFHASRTADETASKPDPRMLLELMVDLDCAPHETLMVGDTEFDLEMADRAGVAAVAVTCGVHGCNRLLKFRPLTLLNSVRELPGWLCRLHTADAQTTPP